MKTEIIVTKSDVLASITYGTETRPCDLDNVSEQQLSEKGYVRKWRKKENNHITEKWVKGEECNTSK